MLEYLDENLGKIKLVNVTEARANFAKLLSDETHYYVITKNNKPQRVVISYDEFVDLRQHSQKNSASTMPSTHEAKIPSIQKHGEKIVAQKHYKTPSRVKGLLAQHFHEPESEPKESVFQESLANTHTQQDADTKWVNDLMPNPESDDYFNTSDPLDEVNAVEEVMLSPDEVIDSHPMQSAVKTESEITNQNSEQVLDEIRHSLSISEEIAPLDSHQALEQSDSSSLKNDNSELDQESQSQTEEAVVPMTPEEEEYYKKYRKLYESVPLRDVPVSTQPQILLDDRDSPVQNIVDSLPDLAQATEDDVARHFMMNRVSDEDLSHKKDIPVQHNHYDVIQSLVNEKSDLPSLQELLRDLDSDEDDVKSQLSDGEIESIIKQIRHEE